MPENNQHKILILDDDEQFNKLLTNIFAKSKTKYLVESFTNPLNALEAAKTNDYKLIVTDYQMPEMNGHEFTLKLREFKSDLPVIMVSAFLSNEKIFDLINLQVMIFLKPLNVFTLIEKIGKLLNNESDPASANSENNSVRAPHIAYPGFETLSNQYYDELLMRRNFTYNLTIRGCEYSPWNLVYQDFQTLLSSNGPCLHIDPKNYNIQAIEDQINSLKKDNPDSTPSLFLPLLDNINPEGLLALNYLLDLQDNTSNQSFTPRLVHSTYQGLDALLESGFLPPKLYIRLGYRTIRLPKLGQIPRDTTQIFHKLLSSKAPSITLTPTAAAIIASYSWPGDYTQLLCVVDYIANNFTNNDILTPALINHAIKHTLTQPWRDIDHQENNSHNYTNAVKSIFYNQDVKSNFILRTS